MNRCFIASPLNADLTFPFILKEKLVSQNNACQLESLKTLKLMILEYPIGKVWEYAEMTWHTLEKEMFNTLDPAVQEGSIEVATALAHRFAVQFENGVQESGSIIESMLLICKDKFLNEPDTVIGNIATSFTCSLIKSSTFLGCSIIKSVVVDSIF